MKTKQSISDSVKKEILRLAAHGYGTRKIALIHDLSRSLVLLG
jgi:DNA-binding CsgD family transcriptional regulator